MSNKLLQNFCDNFFKLGNCEENERYSRVWIPSLLQCDREIERGAIQRM